MNEIIVKGRFLPSTFYDKIILLPHSRILFLCVFTLTFLIQVIISMFEGTLLPSSRVQKPLIDHWTILVGGSFLIPALFYQSSRFYKEVRNVFIKLLENGILVEKIEQSVKGQYFARYSIASNVIIFAFVIFVDFIQFSGANVNVDYVHLIDGRLTFCGWYYSVIFLILAYCIVILLIDTFSFTQFVRRLCNTNNLVPKLLYPDEKCGLADLISLGQRIVAIDSLIGFYFLIIFLNWGEYHSVASLLMNTEEIMMLVGFFLFSPLILFSYFTPIRRLLRRFKENVLRETFIRYGVDSLEYNSSGYAEKIKELSNNGFFAIYDRLLKIDSRLFEFKLLAKVYSLLLVPLFYPLAVWLVTEIVKQKVMK